MRYRHTVLPRLARAALLAGAHDTDVTEVVRDAERPGEPPALIALARRGIPLARGESRDDERAEQHHRRYDEREPPGGVSVGSSTHEKPCRS
jgi:hypothetical protein